MKLSPFAARCRLQIYAKGLDLEFVDPPGGASSEEYKALSPIGRVPALDLGDEVLAESEVICEYLEDEYPDIPLRPMEARDRARVRLISRIADLYIIPPLSTLFTQRDPATRNQAVVDESMASLGSALDNLGHYVQGGPYAVGNALSLADCAMVPIIFICVAVLPTFGVEQPLARHGGLEAWWEQVITDPHCARVAQEMQEALAELSAGD